MGCILDKKIGFGHFCEQTKNGYFPQLKVCFALPRLLPDEGGVIVGGSANAALTLGQAMARSGVQLEIVAPVPKDPVSTLSNHGAHSLITPLPYARSGSLGILEGRRSLLVHSRAKLSEIRNFMPDKLDKLKRTVVFSTEPLNEAEYEDLVRSVHVGIALYDGNVSDNVFYVGYSSGKITQYLKCGIPIIVNNLPLLNELTKKYNCGYSINELNEIATALDKIFARYDYYSEGAKKAFREVLNPEIYMAPLLKRLHLDRNL